jgi:hypothetical protein
MNGPDGIATIVRPALQQRESHNPGQVNGKIDRVLSGAVLALALWDLPSRPLPAWAPSG